MTAQPEILDPGVVLKDAAAVYRQHAAVLLPAALVILLVLGIVSFAVRDSAPLVALPVQVIVGIVFQGMVVLLAKKTREGRPVEGAGQLFAGVGSVFLPLLGVAVVSGIATGVGLALLLVPGLFLLTIWAVVAPVVVLEGRGVFETLGRSRELVRWNGWPTFALVALSLVLQVAVAAPAIAIGAGSLGGAVAQLALGTIVVPFTALVTAMLYFRLLEIQSALRASIASESR